jgi:hypothetical protein
MKQSIIPTYRTATANLTSLCAYTGRGGNASSTISKLSKNNDIIFLQETKLAATDKLSLTKELADFVIFYGNNPQNKNTALTSFTAGVLIAIRRSAFTGYDLSSPTVKQSPSLDGHSLSLKLVPLVGGPSLLLCNVRFTTGADSFNRQELQAQLLSTSLTPVRADFTFLGGDFNFVEHAPDTTSDFVARARPHWENLLRSLKLRDVCSSLHTFFHRPKEGLATAPRSSRLDRFYLSFSEADLLLFKPSVSTVGNPLLQGKGFNGHLPLRLQFLSSNGSPHRASLSEHVVLHDSFRKFVVSLWSRNTAYGNALEKLRAFNNVVRKAYKLAAEEVSGADLLRTFQLAVSLLNAIVRNPEIPLRKIVAITKNNGTRRRMLPPSISPS